MVLDLLLRMISAAVALLPWRALRPVGAMLGFVAGSVLRIRRRAVDDAMRRIDASSAREMYAGLGAGVFELLWVAGGRDPDVVIDDDGALADAMARGPVVIAASHTGNWELAAFAAARAISRSGRRLAIVAKPISLRGFDVFCTRLRKSAGLRLLSPRGALDAARCAIAEGDVVAMPIDQVPEKRRHALRGVFLGETALLDRAPAALAARTGATLLVVAAEREGHRHRVRVLASLRGEGRTWVDEATRDATAALDAFVRRSPASWLWLHRRWRAPREESVRLVASPHPG